MFKEQEEGHKEGGTQWLRGRQVGHAVEVLGRTQIIHASAQHSAGHIANP